jgi:hypothetical protein
LRLRRGGAARAAGKGRRDRIPQAPKSGTSFEIMRCLRYAVPQGIFQDARIEGAMATKQHGQIVETPTEARGAEPGPSVFALLIISTGLAILILGVIWFVFFKT